MIDWLNDNTGAVQGISAVILVGVTSVLVGVTAWYTRETRRIARSTAEQVNASREVAHASLRPVIEQYVVDQGLVRADQNETGQDYYYTDIEYWNVGNGPAVNIDWSFAPGCGQFMEPPRRVGMGIRDKKGELRAEIFLPLPSEFFLVSRYHDVFDNVWCSRLQIVKDSAGKLIHGASTYERVTSREHTFR